MLVSLLVMVKSAQKFICFSLICCLFSFSFYKSLTQASITLASACCCCEKVSCTCDQFGHPNTVTPNIHSTEQFFESATCICKQQSITIAQLKNNLFFEPIPTNIIPFSLLFSIYTHRYSLLDNLVVLPDKPPKLILFA